MMEQALNIVGNIVAKGEISAFATLFSTVVYCREGLILLADKLNIFYLQIP